MEKNKEELRKVRNTHILLIQKDTNHSYLSTPLKINILLQKIIYIGIYIV